MVPFEAGVPGTPVPLAAADVVRDVQWCLTSGVFAGNVVGQVCSQANGSTEPLVVRRVTTEGQVLEPVPLAASSFDGRTILVSTVDRERGALLVWDAGKHVLARVDLLRGDVESVEVPESMLSTEGRAREPSRGYLGINPGIVLSPDGARIYALGIGRGRSEMGVSSGIWVFDGDTLEPLGRFEPRAMLTSLAVSADGTFVYASSPAGFDVEGNENPGWPASVTVYDARNGEIERPLRRRRVPRPGCPCRALARVRRWRPPHPGFGRVPTSPDRTGAARTRALRRRAARHPRPGSRARP